MAVNLRRSAPRNSIGVENVPPLTALRGRGRASSSPSILPSWYPRIPLRDISTLVIERRRARPYEGQQTETLLHPMSVLSSSHEFEKQKKTAPSVKKAEREKRIRTLMSMR